MKRIFVSFFFLLLISACRSVPGTSPPLPKGEQMITGQLVPAELSLFRRGTHLLLQEGQERYFVESTILALQPFEGNIVTLRGTLQPNVTEDILPVLIVSAVDKHEESWPRISIAPLALSLEFPPTWTAEESSDEVLFFSISNPRTAILRIALEDPSPTPTAGPRVRIGGMVGTRVVDEKNGTQVIQIPQGSRVLSLYFLPQDADHLIQERAFFLRLLHSIVFSDPQQSASSAASRMEQKGIPCGGPAGVLCPEGFFCAVEDLKEGIGKCQPIL